MSGESGSERLIEHRWLDQTELNAWMGLMGVFLRLPAALDRQLRADSGISHFDYQVMAMLSEAPDRTMRLSNLASWVEGSLPRLSQVVSRFEDAGWIERRPDPNDGRSTLATLTDDGFSILTNAAPAHVTEVRRLVFNSLTSTQVRQLEGITRSLLESTDSPLRPQ